MRRQQIVGVDYNEGPPVPIPNTEVKLACADNTWLATARDDRLMPTLRTTRKCGFFAFSGFWKRIGKGKITDCQAVHELAKNIKKCY